MSNFVSSFDVKIPPNLLTLFCRSQLLNLAHTLRITGVKLSMECLWSAERFVLFQLFLIYSDIFWRHSCRISLLITYLTMKSFQLVILLQTPILFASSFTPSNLSLRGVTWNSHNWPIRCQNSNLWRDCDQQNI